MASAPIDVQVKVKGLSDLQKLEKRMQVLERQVAKLSAKTPVAANGIRKLGRASKQASTGVQALNAAFIKIAAVIGTVTAAVGVFNQSVARTESERKIQILAGAYGEAAQLADIAARASEKFGNSQTETNNALATTYARLRPVGVGLADIESIYGGFNTAARLAGANAQESAGAFRQLAQALGSGALRGDEFNSIAEQAPLVLQAVSKETGIAVGELRDFAATGGITADTVIKALKRIETEGADQLAESLKGPQQAIKNFQNAFEDLSAAFGKLSEPALIEFFNGLTAVTKSVTDNMDKLAQVAQTLVDFIYKPFQALMSGIQETGPAFDDFGQGVWQVVGMIMKVMNDWIDNVMVPVFNVVGKILGTAISWFWNFAQGVASAMKAAADAVIAGVRAIANAIATLINLTPGGLLGKLLGVDVGEFAAAPLNALANGIDGLSNSVEGYINSVKQAGADFALPGMDRGGAVDRNYAPSTLTSPTQNSGGSSGGGGGGGAASNEAAKQLEIQQKQLKTSQEMVIAAEQAYEKALGMTQLQEIELEQKQNIANIQREYSDLIANAKSEAEELNLNNARALEIATEKLKAEEAIKDLREDALGGIEEEIAALEARINGTEEVYQLEKKIKELVEAGGGTVSEAQARALVERKTALEEQVRVAEELKTSYESLADSIAGNLTGAFKDIITGAKSAEEAMADAFQGIADAFLDMAMQMIQEWIKMQLLGMFTNTFGGGAAGGGQSLVQPIGPMSFAGGGYTGDGPRSGGIDGQGGALAILHPQETVVDHYGAARGAMASGSAVAAGKSELDAQQMEAEILNNPTPIDIKYDSTVINNVSYVTEDQMRAMNREAVKEARARVFADMRNKPATRAQVGI